MTTAESYAPHPKLWISKEAYERAVQSASRALPREAGGILVGWSEGTDFVVSDVLAVEDPSAGHYHYVRNHAAADAALAEYLESTTDPATGYVGEWHSHPMLHPPSGTDYQSIDGVVREGAASAVMLVIAFGAEGITTAFGVVALRDGDHVEILRVAPSFRQ